MQSQACQQWKLDNDPNPYIVFGGHLATKKEFTHDKLSPSHFPTLAPAPANVERVMTKVRNPGLLISIASRVVADIIVP
jgi:hypothetical protein